MATDYWKKREDDWIEECEKDHEKYLKQIKAIYQRMYDELEEHIELFYQRYADNEGITMQEAKKRLTNAEMEKLSRKAKEYCELAALDMRNQNHANEAVYFSEEANAEMAKYNATMRINRLEMLKQYVALSAMKAQANVAGVTREALTEEAMKQHKRLAGILGNTVAGIEAKAKAIAEASFHGQKYSERIWGKNQEELIKRLNKIITDAIIQGKNPDTAIKKMAKDFNVTQQQAKRLVETELQRVKATVYKNQYKESDFDAYEYHAYAGCCKECQKLDGTKHPLKELEPGYTAPPMHPNCRCSTTPYVDMSFTKKYSDEDVDDFDKWCDYAEKHENDPDFITWKNWRRINKLTGELETDRRNRGHKASDITREFISKSQGMGSYSQENNYKPSDHKNETKFVDWFSKKHKGHFTCLTESTEKGQHRPDYLWDGKLWELKSASTVKSVLSGTSVKKGVDQIKTNPGGLFIDIDEAVNDLNELMLNAISIATRKSLNDYYLVFTQSEKIIQVIKIA